MWWLELVMWLERQQGLKIANLHLYQNHENKYMKFCLAMNILPKDFGAQIHTAISSSFHRYLFN